MRSHRLAAAIALCALAGCRTTGAKYLGYGLGGVNVLGGLVGVGQAATGHCDKLGCEFDGKVGVTFLALGAVILTIAASIDVDDEPAAGTAAARPAAAVTTPVPGFASVGEPPTTDPELRRLTLQARVAARRGQCTGVVAIASRVASLDPAYRREGFLADAPVAACLR